MITDAPTTDAPTTGGTRGRVLGFLAFTVVLCLCFGYPLLQLAKYAATNELYSHIFLIPVISIYLAWLQRESVRRCVGTSVGGGTVGGATVALSGPTDAPTHRRTDAPVMDAPTRALAIVGVILGVIALVMPATEPLGLNDWLSIHTFAFLCFFYAGVFFFLGASSFRVFLFPLLFLLFMIPFPTAVTHGIEMFFQHTSAAASEMLFDLTGTPQFRQGMIFQLPGLTIRVAEECSGIRSSLVLFITSLMAGHLFLRTPWKKGALALAVIPLGIIRNAIRIVSISLLSIHVDPSVIHSPLHHRGGPIFFLLSLVPFFGLLLWLRKSEAKPGGGGASAPVGGSRSPTH